MCLTCSWIFSTRQGLRILLRSRNREGAEASHAKALLVQLIAGSTRFGGSPAEIMRHVNERVCAENRDNMFVTVWMGVLETSTGRLTCCNAGHEAPVIGKAGGTFARVEDHHPRPGSCWKPCVKRRWTLPAKRLRSMISRCCVSAGQGKCAPFTISKPVKGALFCPECSYCPQLCYRFLLS